jgi:hypothetical protein
MKFDTITPQKPMNLVRTYEVASIDFRIRSPSKANGSRNT